MARSTYFDLGRSADACPGSESGYAQRFQCGNIVKRRIWTRMNENLVAFTRAFKRGLPEGSKSAVVSVRHKPGSNADFDVLTIVFANGPRH